MKKIIFTITIVLLSLITVTLLILDKNELENNMDKITIAEVTHSVFYAPQYIALKKGFFEEEGLDVSIIVTPGGDKVSAALLSNDAQIGLAGLETVVYVNNSDSTTKFKSFAGLTKKDGSFIITKEDYENFTLDNLKNSHIIAGREGGMPAMTLAYVLNENGFDLEKDIYIDTSIAYSAMQGAFINNVGDVVTMFEPSASNMEKNSLGYVQKSIGEFTKDLPYTVYYSTEEYIKNNKEELKKFNEAINKAMEYIETTDNKTLASELLEFFPDASLNSLENSINLYKTNNVYRLNTTIKKDEVEYLSNIMLFNKVISDKIEYDNVIDTSIFGEK